MADVNIVEIKTPQVVDPAAGKPAPEGTITEDGLTLAATISTDQKTPAKADEAKPPKPAWLPDGYDTPEAFVEAWKAGKAAPPAAPADPAAPSAPGMDLSAYSKEYAEKGQLSPESLAALDKAGIKRDVVDTYIEGQKALAAQQMQRLTEALGGKENLDATLKWAGTALSADEQAAANAALQSGNEAVQKLMLTGLHQRRLAEVGVEPSLVSGRSAPGRGDVAPYESSTQYVKDMSSKAYREDPAFRAKVMQRLAVSQL